jgi:hypothetical protein
MRFKNNHSLHKFLTNFSKRKSSYLAVYAAVIGVSVLLSIFALSGHAYAGGGVGSGGSGGGGSGGTGNWTYYGWGWAAYPTGSAGPTDGFFNGTSWSSVQSICQGAGASQVYADIVDDSNGHGMVYNYLTIEETPYVYAGHFATGTSVDGGRAVAIDTGTANNAFNALGSDGVSTAGFTFGVNVAWFCYDFSNGSMTGDDVNSSGTSEGSGFGATITVDSNTSTTSNPYSFSTLSVGSHTVQATAPSGYVVVGSTWCDSSATCDPGHTSSGTNYNAGSSTSITVTVNSSVQMKWIFDLVPPAPPSITVTPPTCANPVIQGDIVDSSNTSTYTVTNDSGQVIGSGGTGMFSVTVTAYRGINARNFTITAKNSGGTVEKVVILPSCATPSCSASLPILTPTSPQQGKSVKITATATWAPYGSRGTGAPTLPGDGFTITSNDLTGISAGSALTWDEPKESQTFTATAGAPGANFTVTAKIDDSSCASPLTVANEPYFNVDGGDTMSGSGFMSETNNTACTETTGAGTYAWNNNNTPNYYGSGTSGAAFSVSKTDEFTTNNGQSATGSVIGTPDSLSFSNDSADDGGTPYGGDFNSANCVPDYYKQLLAAEGTNPDITSPGSSVITAYPTTNGDRNVYLFTGNVYIGNGPGDTNLGLPAGANYSSPTTMPYFYVVTKGGNIYIDGNVANLAGVFIAEPSTTTSVSSGQIYTCADNTTKTEYASANIFTNCSTQLDVDGAFVAKDVHFLRTNGSVDLAGASSSCAVADPNVAEKICYTPMLWLASPFPPSSNDVQSIISLPGVL